MRKKRSVRASLPMFACDTVVLRGEKSATVYGCRKILWYSPERICLLVEGRGVSVTGRSLYCASFSAGTVTLVGEVLGAVYCASCRGRCDLCNDKAIVNDTVLVNDNDQNNDKVKDLVKDQNNDKVKDQNDRSERKREGRK